MTQREFQLLTSLPSNISCSDIGRRTKVCASANARIFLGGQIRDSALSFVSTNCWQDDRKVLTHNCQKLPAAPRGLYVHPQSGLLIRTKA